MGNPTTLQREITHAAGRRDRPLFPDHNAMAEAVKKGSILNAVEEAIGVFQTSWN